MAITARTATQPSPPRTRVLVADDHPAVARGIERLIGDQPDLQVIGVALDAHAALGLPDCDVAVVDYHLGERSGLWLTRRLKRRPDPPGVVLYSAFSDDVLALAGAIAGADGVLRKSAAAEELCVAIRHVAVGHRYLPKVPGAVMRALSSRIAPEHRPAFSLLAHGWAAPRISEHLGIDLDQVELARHAAVDVLSPSASRARAPLGPVRDLQPMTPAR